MDQEKDLTQESNFEVSSDKPVNDGIEIIEESNNVSDTFTSEENVEKLEVPGNEEVVTDNNPDNLAPVDTSVDTTVQKVTPIEEVPAPIESSNDEVTPVEEVPTPVETSNEVVTPIESETKVETNDTPINEEVHTGEETTSETVNQLNEVNNTEEVQTNGQENMVVTPINEVSSNNELSTPAGEITNTTDVTNTTEVTSTPTPEVVTPIVQEVNINSVPPITNSKNKTELIILIVIVVLGCLFIITSAFHPSSPSTPSTPSGNGSGDPVTEAKEETFYGSGFTLKYKSPWAKENKKTTNGYSDLLYYHGTSSDAYILPLGKSAMDEIGKFDTYSDKKEFYNQFYELWNTDSYKLGTNIGLFSTLSDGIYYATIDYERTDTTAYGRFYIIVKPENNIVLSFNTSTNKKYALTTEIHDVMKTISITAMYNETIGNTLSSLSAWNMYKSARTGVSLGSKKAIQGEWQILSTSDTVWKFDGNEFYWYKSGKERNDNYWYGTFKSYTGKEGLKKVGLSESKVDEIVADSDGKTTSDDIITLIFTPKKIISGGVDKSSTNITGEDWHFVWIIVDHRSEGVEGQYLNVKNSETSYYFKIKD